MKPGIEEKIQRVHQHYSIKKKGREKRIYGPYWFGYWWENGKQKRAYIGKELTAGLRRLLEGRFKRPGYTQYTWPDLKK
ncbi:hypothetical protein ES705_25660 [subsurface metagenome]